MNFKEVCAEFESKYPKDPPDRERIRHLIEEVQRANKLPVGDYVEMGIHHGLTLKIIHQFMDQNQALYGFDTFSGFDARDIAKEKELYRNHWAEGNFDTTSVEEVKSYLDWPDNLQLIVGWIPESFVPFRDRVWRFAHLDMDLYEPMKAALNLLWPRMVPGGIIMVHDYGVGGFRVNQVVDEFCSRIGISPMILTDMWRTAILRKGKK